MIMKRIKTLSALIIALSLLLAFGSGAFAESASADLQLGLISAGLPSLAAGLGENWYYAVTDFDHNGRLELLAASGHGPDATAKVWEVNSSFDGFTKCGSLASAEASLPDMLTESADTFFNPAKGTWSYRFNDAESMQGGYNSRICSLMLLGGNFVYDVYASQSSEMMNGMIVVTFTDSYGNIITPDEYNSAAAKAFEGCERSSTSFGWFRLSDAVASAQTLADSYAVFTGEKEPPEESVIRENQTASAETAAVPVPAAADAPQTEQPLPSKTAEGYEIVNYDGSAALEIVYPAQPSYQEDNPDIVYPTQQPYQPENPVIVYPTPTPVPKFVPLTITRNPTNEYRRVDSTARFVACASTFNGLTWVFVDPSGCEVSLQEFSSRFPGSSVDGSSTTLSVSNVTQEMDGWGAYCVFYTNDGQTASSSTAYIIMK